MADAVVVGAGPAGVAAAAALAEADLEVMLVDEAPRPGGQVHRSPPDGLDLDMAALLAAGHDAYRAFHARFAALRPRIDYRPQTLAWNVFAGEIHLAARGALEAVPWRALVLATGATDRVLPVRGWTLPGVYTLGGAQAILKDQGCLIGRRVVFCGSSPLLYLAAVQYLRMGGEVAAILDTTPFARKVAAAPRLAAAPRTFAEGLGHMARLRRSGVAIVHGAHIVAMTGDGAVDGVTYRGGDGVERRTACDAVACGFGLRPETQLAELAGCALRFDPIHRQWFPRVDGDGRAGNGVYLAGDGAAIGGAAAAALSGRLAGLAAVADLRAGTIAAEAPRLRRALHRLRRFQHGLAEAFAWPHGRVADIADDVAICRCEGITAGEVRRAVGAVAGALEVNRVKAATRCGMGRCQGRFCGPAAAELTAAALGRSDGEIGRLRAQPPVKPLPIAVAPAEDAA
ncbi:MAG: FAD-dependent oxidoreductase [Alphaproteobacteria bacterium]|nr:FAD-dependent oxidoreductase [Alphaproteobacteria bacterium]